MFFERLGVKKERGVTFKTQKGMFWVKILNTMTTF